MSRASSLVPDGLPLGIQESWQSSWETRQIAKPQRVAWLVDASQKERLFESHRV